MIASPVGARKQKDVVEVAEKRPYGSVNNEKHPKKQPSHNDKFYR